MSYILFLDDHRQPGANIRDHGDTTSIVVWVKTAEDAMICIRMNGIPHTIHFDHDLGWGDTGYDFALDFSEYVTRTGLKLPGNFQFFVHSQNPVGAANIRGLMTNFVNNMKE